MKKSWAIFQPGKVWKKVLFWSVSLEKGNNLPELIF